MVRVQRWFVISALVLTSMIVTNTTSLAQGAVNPNPDLNKATAEAIAPPSDAVPMDNNNEKAEAIRAVQEAVQVAKDNIQASSSISAPALPATIQSLVNSGARAAYLGRHQEFDGWIIMNNGAPSYVYISPDGNSIFRGLLFDKLGNPITLQQVAEAQLRDPEFFGIDPKSIDAQVDKDVERGAGQTLYDALSVSNYFTMGTTDKNAPVLYAFIDPDCPHCKKFIRDAYPKYIENNRIQLRVIPVGVLSDESSIRSATLLNSQDPAQLLLDHAFNRDEIALDPDVPLDGQNLNVNLFTLWQFGGTPIFVFKDKNGDIQMVRGTPNDIDATINLIGNGS